MPPRHSDRQRNLRAVRPSRAARPAAPVADDGLPPKPPTVAGHARMNELWDWYVEELDRHGLLRPLAWQPLMRLVTAIVRWEEADERIRADGSAVPARRDELVRHPSLSTLRQCEEAIRKAHLDLGVRSPVARRPVPADPERRDPARFLTPPTR